MSAKRHKPVDIDARVAIATCANVAEASMVKALLASHDIVATVSGENHAAALGGAGILISLRVQVAASDAEQARELIAQMRNGSGVSDEDLASEAMAAGEGANADPDLARELAIIERQARGEKSKGNGRLELKKRRSLSALLALLITFGTGHAVATAWLRAIL
jgi:hypothetical protein